MIQECVELCGLGILTSVSFLATRRFERTQRQADYIVRALMNPSLCVNTVEEILDSYNPQIQFLNALGIKRLRKKEFKQSVVFEVMVRGRISTAQPVFVNGYWCAVVAVDSPDEAIQNGHH